MTYIERYTLVIVIKSGAGGVAVTTIPFSSLPDAEKASTVIKNNTLSGYITTTIIENYREIKE